MNPCDDDVQYYEIEVFVQKGDRKPKKTLIAYERAGYKPKIVDEDCFMGKLEQPNTYKCRIRDAYGYLLAETYFADGNTKKKIRWFKNPKPRPTDVPTQLRKRGCVN